MGGSRIEEQKMNWAPNKLETLVTENNDKLIGKEYDNTIIKLFKDYNKLYVSATQLYDTNPTCELGSIINSLQMVFTEMKKL